MVETAECLCLSRLGDTLPLPRQKGKEKYELRERVSVGLDLRKQDVPKQWYGFESLQDED